MQKVSLVTRTALKIGKSGRPAEWADQELVKEQVKTVLIGDWKDNERVRSEWEKLDIDPTRFKLPAWAVEDGKGGIIHKDTKKEYYWCLCLESQEPRLFAGDTEITGDKRVEKLLGRPVHTGVEPYVMSFLLSKDSVVEIR